MKINLTEVEKTKCPLCETKKIKELEIIRKDELTFLYKKMTKIDFSYLINKGATCKFKPHKQLISPHNNF